MQCEYGPLVFFLIKEAWAWEMTWLLRNATQVFGYGLKVGINIKRYLFKYHKGKEMQILKRSVAEMPDYGNLPVLCMVACSK